MREQINKIKENSIQEINNCTDLKSLNDLRVKYLGKKGELTAVLRGMGALSAEERPLIGSLVNTVRDELESLIQEKENLLREEELNEKLKSEVIDVTLPATKVKRGSKHPINRIIEELVIKYIRD